MTHPPIRTHSVRLQVPFYHVDPMQVVWHGHYFKYFEAARDGLFEAVKVNFQAIYSTSGYLFPVVRGTVKFIRPLRYKDVFMCEARVVEAKRKIVTEYEIRLASDNTRCTTGSTEQVALKMPDADIEYEIPGEIRKALGQ